MAAYFRWLQYLSDDPNEVIWHIKFPIECMTRWWLRTGVPIDDWDSNLIAHCSSSGQPTDFPTVRNDWPVHSKRLKTLLELKVKKKIQYLPFKLMSADESKEIRGYWVANYLGLVDCLDRNKTTVWKDWTPVNKGGDFSVEKVVLSARLIGDEQLFRIQGARGYVVIRDDLKDMIEQAGMTGCVFQELETCY